MSSPHNPLCKCLSASADKSGQREIPQTTELQKQCGTHHKSEILQFMTLATMKISITWTLLGAVRWRYADVSDNLLCPLYLIVTFPAPLVRYHTVRRHMQEVSHLQVSDAAGGGERGSPDDETDSDDGGYGD